MAEIYHAGELAVQAQAGVQEMARKVGQGIKPVIATAARNFLRDQSLALIGSADQRGQVWASLLTGAPGFLQTPSEQTVRVAAAPLPGDPLSDNLRDGADVGLLAIDLATRRRMRVNGVVELRPDGFTIRARQVYSNCHKYIQARRLEPRANGARQAATVSRTDRLTPAQQAWISRTDTFFIASAHPNGGADISHRGGNPGFVRVVDATTLIVPDYAGNTMFQTLGNLHVNPQAGLLAIDFANGATLQLTGTARIIWDPDRVAAFTGAQRLLEITVAEAVEMVDGSPFFARAVEPSPFNPA